MKRTYGLLALLCLAVPFLLNAQRGRVQMAHGTVVSDVGTNLRGAFISTDWGTTYSLPADTKQKILALPTTYGFNTVHLYLEKYDSPTGCNVRSADSLVAWTAQANMYLVITIGCGTQNGSFNLRQAKDFWTFYAGRYANQTHVIYEIHNEPIFACNGDGTSAEDVKVVDMEVQCYNIIRSQAPNTHVILYSNGGLSHTSQLQGMINGFQNGGISFSNASIGYHGYYWCVNARDGMGYDNNTEALALDPLIAAGYNFISTEFDHAATLTGDETKNGKLLKFYEERNTSWLSFFDIVNSNSAEGLNSSFITGVEDMGLTWTPDYGTWPAAGAAGPVVTARGDNPPDETISKLVDGDPNTKWFDYSPTSWVQLDYGAAKTWIAYDITSANDMPVRDPKAWTIQGSVNGSNWTTLDTRSNQSWASRLLKKSFTFTNATAYRYYRWNITANQSGNEIQVAELKFRASAGDTEPPTAPTNVQATNITTTGFQLSWTASTDNSGSIETYQVWDAAAILGTTTATSFTATGFTCNTAHAITIKAKDATGNTASSNVYNVTTLPCANSYVKENGTAYRWSKNTTVRSNANRVAAPGLNDNNMVSDVGLNNNTDDNSNTFESAGLIFSAAKNITRVEFINGTYGGSWDNGSFDAGIQIQTTTNGSTWTAPTGWTLTPAYQYLSTSVSGTLYTFTGSATGILGIRVTGKVHTSATTGSWEARCREITAYSGAGVAAVAANKRTTGTLTPTDIVYPNPATNTLYINTGKASADVRIFAPDGRMLYQGRCTGSTMQIGIGGWSRGVYFVRIADGVATVFKKVLVR